MEEIKNLRIETVMQANDRWFSPQNKKLFGDIVYIAYECQGLKFLVRKTNAWTDMFDGIKKTHWRINRIEQDLQIGDLFDDVFSTLGDCKKFIRGGDAL